MKRLGNYLKSYSRPTTQPGFEPRQPGSRDLVSNPYGGSEIILVVTPPSLGDESKEVCFLRTY